MTDKDLHSPGFPANRLLTVLAVDDDDLVLDTLAEMLEHFGHTVVKANSGVEALDAFRQKPTIDLVVTDHVMPRMMGAKLVETLREKQPDLPAVLATGHIELAPETFDLLVKLSKPFGPRDLARAIAAALSQKPGTCDAADFD